MVLSKIGGWFRRIFLAVMSKIGLGFVENVGWFCRKFALVLSKTGGGFVESFL